MIWGKTIEKKNYNYWTKYYRNKWFAWHPVQLNNNRWVWWEYVIRTDRRTIRGKHWDYESLENLNQGDSQSNNSP